jgi:ABC-type multidrug transport system fused ATPase/permease subunit
MYNAHLPVSAILLGVMSYIRSYGLASFGIRSSFHLHGGVLRSVLRAPMSFFDTTPTGRILSRFSKDMYTVDNEICDQLDIFVWILLQLVVVLVTIVVITPFFAAALPILGTIYILAMNYFRRVSRETKRLESIARSPVYSQFSEVLGGLSTVRAYGKTQSFTDSFDELLDTNTRTTYCNKAADRWLATRLESIAAVFVGLAGIFATQVVVNNGVSVDSSTASFASLAGISLSYAISATGIMQYVVRSFAQVEAAMNSVERILYYTESIPQEAALTSSELEQAKSLEPLNAAQKAIAAADGKALYPTKDWPESGAFVLNNLKMRYRAETPLVLKGLDVHIKGGDHIGVVGRTGSGKSSLLLVLMRIVEPYISDDEKYQPPLSLDGVDIMRIGLLDLRTKIGIIPQLPVLFSGTVRSNMDPFNSYTDEDIWSALDKCKMKEFVEHMTDGLQSRVAEYGSNLSQGQRQLLCLGRALLKNVSVLLLDEATSSVDYDTDKKIQATIREAFAGATIITIAHRVNTIMDSDKILVMDNGVVGEYDSPTTLLADKKSLFSEIVKHSGGGEDNNEEEDGAGDNE